MLADASTPTLEAHAPLAPIVPSRAGAAATSVSPTRADRFRAIFDAHYDHVWRVLRRFGVPAHAVDDVAQEVFVVAARRLDDIRDGAERAFLFGTARRLAADARKLRRRSPDATDGEVPLDHRDPLPDPEQRLEIRRAAALLDAVLETMEEDLRVAFVLFELEGFSKSEVAETLGIPEGTAASRLRRARDAFLAAVHRIQAKRGFDGGEA